MYRSTVSFVCAVVSLCLPACASGRPDGSGPSRETESVSAGQADALREPSRALAYVAGDAPTDRLIARALDAVRAKPAEPAAYSAAAILFIRRAREAQDPELYRLADDLVKAALSRGPEDKLALGLQAMILQQNHRFREARDVGQRIVSLDPQDTTGHIVLGDALLELGEYDDAAAQMQTAIDLRPDLRSYNRGAYLRWLHGDVDGAVELYALSVDAGSVRDPESMAFCLAELADLEWYRGRLDASLTVAERALVLAPDYQPALRARARVLWAQGHRDDAIRVLDNAVAERAIVDDLLMLSDWLSAQGRGEEAARSLGRAKSMTRDDPRGVALFYARHDLAHAEALRLAERELVSRQNIYSHAAHALALARLGRANEAVDAMRRATALGTPDPRLWMIDAVVALAGGNLSGARASWSRARAMNADADPVLAAELEQRLGETASGALATAVPSALEQGAAR